MSPHLFFAARIHIGLDRGAATEAFDRDLSAPAFSVNEIRSSTSSSST